LETKLFDQSVTFTPVKVVISEKEELVVKKGFLLPKDSKDEVVTIASAFVSTAVSYYAKVNDAGHLADLPREKDLKRLNWVFPNFGPFRIGVDNTTKSPNISQSEIYAKVRATPCIAFHLMSGILSKVPQFSQPEPGLTAHMKKFYSKEKVPEDKQYVMLVPKKISLSIIHSSADACGDLWKYLFCSRQIRGEDTAGIGSLSMGYYFFHMPRSVAKLISLIYDFRALMKHYGVDHIFLSSGTPEYVKRALVCNKYYVICPDDITYPRYDGDKPGIYCTIGVNKSALVVKELVCNRPDLAKGIVNYPTVDLSIVENCVMIVKDRDSVCQRYTVTKLPLMPSLCTSTLSLFPSSQPHNGYVWVGGIRESGTYNFDKLCLRSVAANIYRNHYPINCAAYWCIDPMMAFFCYGEAIILPRLSNAKIEKEEKMFNFEAEKEEKEKDSIAFAPETLIIDVSEYEKESVDPNAYTIGDLTKIIASLRSQFPTDDDFREFFFLQRDRAENGNTINHFLAKLLSHYAWQDVYCVLAKLGDDFDAEFKKYMEIKGKYTEPDPVIAPPESRIPVLLEPEHDSDSDDQINITFSGDYNEK